METDVSTDTEEDEESSDPTATVSAEENTTANGTDAAQSNGNENTIECVDAGAVDTSGFETYTNTDDGAGYSIKHPASWGVSDDYPEQAFIEGTDSESVVVTVEDAPGETTDEAFEALLEEAEETMWDFAEHCQREVTLSSGQTGKFVYFDGYGGGRGVSLIAVVDGTSYTVEGTLVVGATDIEVNQTMAAVVESFAVGTTN